MVIIPKTLNFQIVLDDLKAYCVSYGQIVAEIDENGVYKENSGYMFFSKTSNKHKNQFKKELSYRLK